MSAAAAEMDAIVARLARQYPDQHNQGNFGVTLQPLRQSLLGDSRPVLGVLAGAVALVLLLACANVANLMLARGEARRRELSVRAALGASRFRVARQLVTEALLLSILGTAAGLAVAHWALDVVVAAGPNALPRLANVGAQPAGPGLRGRAGDDHDRAVRSGAGAAAVAGRRGRRVEGRRPGRFIGRARPRPPRAGGRPGGDGGGAAGWRRAAAQEFRPPARRLRRVRRRPGADREDRGAGDTLSRAGRGLRFLHHDWSSVRRESPASSAPEGARGCRLPFLPATGASTSKGVRGSVDAGPAPPTGMSSRRDISRPCGIPIIAGRGPLSSDTAPSPPVIFLNQAAARGIFPGEDPVGKRVQLSRSRGFEQPWRTVAGVVGDVRQRGLDVPARPEMYIPHTQFLHFSPGSAGAKHDPGAARRAASRAAAVRASRRAAAARPGDPARQRAADERGDGALGGGPPAQPAAASALLRCWRSCSPPLASTA